MTKEAIWNENCINDVFILLAIYGGFCQDIDTIIKGVYISPELAKTAGENIKAIEELNPDSEFRSYHIRKTSIINKL